MPAIWVPTVRTIADGEPVAASTDNGPITDLTNRTDWLKQQLDGLVEGTQLLLRNQAIESGLVPGAPVYLDDTTDTFKPALATIDTSNLSIASNQTFWQGIVLTASGTVGDIVIGGSMTLTPLVWAAAFQSGVFSAGDIFLSAVVPGRITTDIGTAGVYLGHMRASGEMLVRLGNPNAFIDHVHYQRILSGNPAGVAVDPGIGNPQIVDFPNPALQGWLPATAVYFPGFVVGVQIPTGAKFGYNIQQPAETELRAIFPLTPPDNAQFSQLGAILYPDKVITNQYGIWWMDDSYGNAPWVPATGVGSDIYLWTTRLIASAEVTELVIDAVIQALSGGLIDTLAVSSLLSTDPATLAVVGSEGDGISGWKGAVSVTPNGVNVGRYHRGLQITGTTGNNTTGYRGILDFEFIADLEAKHLWTEVTNIPLDTYALVSTNGYSGGSSINLMAHRLGPDATDFIDFLLVGGRDLTPLTDYQPSIVIHAAVDTPSAPTTSGDVEVEFYRLSVGQPLSSSRLQRTEQVAFSTGVPGRMQVATVGPFVDVILRQGERTLVRIKPSTGGSPLTADTLRVLGIYYNLTEV